MRTREEIFTANSFVEYDCLLETLLDIRDLLMKKNMKTLSTTVLLSDKERELLDNLKADD